MSKPVCVVWMNEAKAYEQALARMGLLDRFEFHSLKNDDPLPEDLAARTDILVGRKPGSYLKRMPKLRWIQAMTAGVDPWLASPDLSTDGDAVLRARLASHIDAREHPRRAVSPHQALHADRARSAREPLDETPVRAARRQDARHTGLGAIGQELARKAAALEMRVIGTKRTPAPLPHVEKVYAPEETDEVLGAVGFRAAAAAVHARDRELHQQGSFARDEADGVAAQFRARRADRRCGPDRRGAIEDDRRRRARRVPQGAAAGDAPVLADRRHPGAAASRRRTSRARRKPSPRSSRTTRGDFSPASRSMPWWTGREGTKNYDAPFGRKKTLRRLWPQ